MQSSSQIVTANKPTSSLLQTGCPSCRPDKCQTTKGKSTKFHGLAQTNPTRWSSNLLFDRKRLTVTFGEELPSLFISPLTPVPKLENLTLMHLHRKKRIKMTSKYVHQRRTVNQCILHNGHKMYESYNNWNK